MLVKFEISFKGSSKFKDFQVNSISIKLEGVATKINAYIIHSKFNEERRLTYRFEDLKGSRVLDTFSIDPNHAQTIKLQAHVLKTIELHNHLIRHDDGNISKEETFCFDKLPISITKPTKFDEGKRYRIQVENNGEQLQAKFIEVTSALNITQQVKNIDKEKNLQIAAKDGDIIKAKELLGKGINFNAKNEFGHSALTLAAREGHLEIVQLLLQQTGIEVSVEALILASKKGFTKIVQELLPHVNINDRDEYGDTALGCASKYGYSEIVQLLSKQEGIVLNVQDSFGNTPLILATSFNHADVVEILLKKKDIDVTARDFEGNTAQMIAKNDGYDEIVALFESHKKRLSTV